MSRIKRPDDLVDFESPLFRLPVNRVTRLTGMILAFEPEGRGFHPRWVGFSMLYVDVGGVVGGVVESLVTKKNGSRIRIRYLPVPSP